MSGYNEGEMMSIKKFRYDKEGLDRFFGPLEAKIMDILWTGTEKSIKEVQELIEKERTINFNTVMTVMNRLVEKSLLEKRVIGRTSYYKPVKTRMEFIDEESKKISDNLLNEFGAIVVNHMIDSLESVDQNLLDKLEKKINLLKKGSK